MDDIVYDQIKKMSLKNVELIRLVDFEDAELLAIKTTRTLTEYCWTLSSSLPLYVLKKAPSIEHIAYLDSDLFFFSSPQPVYDEMGDNSIAIVRHNYSKELSSLEKNSGIYNVSMIIFKNDDRGIACLTWWRERCLEWCYARYEDGKFGDQVYLNDWPEKFPGTHVVKHKGINLAPWNMNKYVLSEKDGKVFVDEDPLIYYHCHSFKMYAKNDFMLYNFSYLMFSQDVLLIYGPYKDKINDIIDMVVEKYPEYTYGFDKRPNIRTRLIYLLKKHFAFLLYYRSLKKVT